MSSLAGCVQDKPSNSRARKSMLYSARSGSSPTTPGRGSPRKRPGRMYDVSADGQRFLMIKMIKETKIANERPPAPRIIFVQNWFKELKSLVPTR